MTTQGKQQNEQYREARRQFDDLRIEDKAVFLLESTVSTLARGLEEFGRVVSDNIERSFEEAERRREKREAEPSSPSTGATSPTPDETHE